MNMDSILIIMHSPEIDPSGLIKIVFLYFLIVYDAQNALLIGDKKKKSKYQIVGTSAANLW